MFALAPAALLIFAAAITPGPNNIIVMDAASRDGLRGGGRAIAGVMAGSLLLLSLSAGGVAALIAAEPRAQLALSWLGAAWLIWAGGAMIGRAGAAAADTGRNLPTTASGVAAFQLINPKAWLLVLTATATATSGNSMSPGTVLALAAVLTGVTGLCLALWGLAGAGFGPWLAAGCRRKAFDRLMGAALIASAVALLVQPAV